MVRFTSKGILQYPDEQNYHFVAKLNNDISIMVNYEDKYNLLGMYDELLFDIRFDEI